MFMELLLSLTCKSLKTIDPFRDHESESYADSRYTVVNSNNVRHPI